MADFDARQIELGQKIRVLIVGPFPRSAGSISGGVEAVITYLCSAMRERPDIDLHGLHLGDSDTRCESSHRGFGFPIHEIGATRFGLVSGFRRHRKEFAQILAKIQPEIVHGHGANLPGFLAIESGRPNIVTIHGLVGEDVKYKSGLRSRLRGFAMNRLIERRVVSNAKHLITISPYVDRYYGGRIRAIKHQIPNPVPEEFFRIQRKAERGRMLFAGRVVPLKGVLELVRALSCIKDGVPGSLHIAGPLADARYVAKIREVIDRNGLTQRVTFHGLLDEAALFDQFSRAAVLALPSFQENAPMVIQQAMAAGLPVIASSVGGIPDLITDGRSGLLVQPGNVNALADKLRTILGNPQLAEQISVTGKEIALNEFRLQTIVSKTVRAYKSVIEDG